MEKLSVSNGDVRTSDKKLFTPGPLGVSLTTKQAMLHDFGSRDIEFLNTVKWIRSKLLQVAGLSEESHTCVLMQGSGTFCVEAALTTCIPRENPRILVLVNGAYGSRMVKIIKTMGVDEPAVEVMTFAETEKVSASRVEEKLKEDSNWTNVAIVHCETTSGVVNPITAVGKLVKKYCPNAMYVVDAMSSFGAIPFDFVASNIDFMISSANKCIEGVPGFGYVIVKKDKLMQCKGNSRSFSLDLYDQWEAMERNGQFRFTPATHAMLALKQALHEMDAEGGIKGRAARYQENRRVLREGMKELGFHEYLDDTHEGYIITTFHYPKHPNFDFTQLFQRLSDIGLVIYPGKVTQGKCFRIANVGHLFPDDMRHLLSGIRQVFADMAIPLPLEE